MQTFKTGLPNCQNHTRAASSRHDCTVYTVCCTVAASTSTHSYSPTQPRARQPKKGGWEEWRKQGNSGKQLRPTEDVGVGGREPERKVGRGVRVGRERGDGGGGREGWEKPCFSREVTIEKQIHCKVFTPVLLTLKKTTSP